MATPTILIVPDRFKSGVLYSQLPESGAVDFGVTRATTAYRTNASGILESVASGVPRLDYPAAGGCPSLLVEPAATNLLLRSEEFDDVYWTKDATGTGTAPIVTANDAIAPNGTLTADRIDFNRGAGNTLSDDSRLRSGSITVTSGTVYNGGFFIKAATVSDIGKQIVLRHVAAGLYTVITLTSQYQRIAVSETAAGTSRVFEIGNRGTFTNSNTVSVHMWGAQLEVGSVATSYIPTVAATATRNADVISKTGVSGFIGQTEGTLYAEVDFRALTLSRRVFGISDGTASNRLAITINLNQFRIVKDAVIDLLPTSSIATGVHKMAVAYTNSEIVFYFDGALIGTSVTSGAGVYSQIHLACTEASIAQFNDRIRAAAIYTTRLSNTELAALTTL